MIFVLPRFLERRREPSEPGSAPWREVPEPTEQRMAGGLSPPQEGIAKSRSETLKCSDNLMPLLIW